MVLALLRAPAPALEQVLPLLPCLLRDLAWRPDAAPTAPVAIAATASVAAVAAVAVPAASIPAVNGAAAGASVLVANTLFQRRAPMGPARVRSALEALHELASRCTHAAEHVRYCALDDDARVLGDVLWHARATTVAIASAWKLLVALLSGSSTSQHGGTVVRLAAVLVSDDMFAIAAVALGVRIAAAEAVPHILKAVAALQVRDASAPQLLKAAPALVRSVTSHLVGTLASVQKDALLMLHFVHTAHNDAGEHVTAVDTNEALCVAVPHVLQCVQSNVNDYLAGVCDFFNSTNVLIALELLNDVLTGECGQLAVAAMRKCAGWEQLRNLESVLNDECDLELAVDCALVFEFIGAIVELEELDDDDDTDNSDEDENGDEAVGNEAGPIVRAALVLGGGREPAQKPRTEAAG